MFKLCNWWTAALLTGFGLMLGPSRAQEMSNKQCLECHSDKELTKTNALGKTVSLFVDEAKLTASTHNTNSCASCHTDLKSTHPDDNLAAKPVDCARCHDKPSQSYQASVHGLALQAGKSGVATCKDCHGTHDVLAPTSPASPLHYSKLAATCGECHSEQAQDLQASVHGKATAKGVREAPTCTDCHSEHKIEGLKGASAKLAGEMCSKCHASERINTKYSLPADRVQTFSESYHGLASQYGSTRAANCPSCHGVHKILPSSDPNSSIHANHLVETCGKCHPGATAKFALAKVHVNGGEPDFGATVNRVVRRAYVSMIVVVIGLMLLHNGLIWGRKVLASYRTRSRTVLRMSKAQRLQHFALLLSFILLALTGFALKYPDSWLAWILGGDENVRRWIHRVAGVVLLVAGAIHLVYLFAAAEGRQLLRDLFPRMQDVNDAALNVRHLATGRGPKPRFGRFGYIEKAEYWAVVWGTVIMGVTGLMIWLKIDVTQYLPRWAVDLATTIHYYEAILACLAIVVWHFYHVFFDPDVYPVSWAWWDGKVDAHWYAEEHPLDADRLGSNGLTSAPTPAVKTMARSADIKPGPRHAPDPVSATPNGTGNGNGKASAS
jgi:formate dehydrogenase gamma subunit